MELKFQFFFIQCLTYCTLLNFPYGSALKGDNVRIAQPNEFRSIVSINRILRCPGKIENLQHCTGTLLGERHILTAAHCLFGLYVNDTVVIATNTDLNSGKMYFIESWITFDEWQFGISKAPLIELLYNDVAIITLTKSVDNLYFVPAQLLHFMPQDVYKSRVRIAGWGSSANGLASNLLKTGTVKVITNKECEKSLQELTNQPTLISDDYFCSRDDPSVLTTYVSDRINRIRKILLGDSGGPLFNNQDQVVGINIGTCPQKRQLCNYTEELKCQNEVNLHLNLYNYRHFIFCHVYGYLTDCQVAQKLKNAPPSKDRLTYQNHSPLSWLY